MLFSVSKATKSQVFPHSPERTTKGQVSPLIFRVSRGTFIFTCDPRRLPGTHNNWSFNTTIFFPDEIGCASLTEADFSTLLLLWFMFVPRSSVRQRLWTFVFFKTLFRNPNSINTVYASTHFFLTILWTNKSQGCVILVLSDPYSSEKWPLISREIVSSTKVDWIMFHNLFCIYTGVVNPFKELKKKNCLIQHRIRFFSWVILLAKL